MTILFPALKQAEEKLAAAQKDLANVFEQAGPELDVKKVKGIEGDVVDFIRTKNAELDDLGKEVKRLQDVAKAAENVKGFERTSETGSETKGEGPSDIGGMFVKSASFKSRNVEQSFDIELKTVMNTVTSGDGWQPETTRTGKIVESIFRPVQVTDIIPTTTTSQQAIVFMQEDTFTNAATEVGESTNSVPGTYPEQELSLSEASSPVRKLAVWIPVTDEQLEDEAGARGYINRRLPLMLRLRLDSQILNGNGTAPNLRGIMQTTNVQTQAAGTDAVPDAVYKALTKVRVGGRAIPGAVVINSTDWQNIRLLRTADGVYIWGSPSESGTERLWGLPVVINEVLAQGTALVGDFANYSELAVKRGIEMQITNSHAGFFIEGKQAIRADMRCALVVYRPQAFCTVTGLPATITP